MIDLIHTLLKKQGIIYVYKEIYVKNELGWYYIKFKSTDKKTYDFTCWYNDTAVGKTPFDLITCTRDISNISLCNIGEFQESNIRVYYTAVKMDKSRIMQIERNILEKIRSVFRSVLPKFENINIDVTISFNPVFTLLYTIIENGVLLGRAILLNDKIIPVGLCDQKVHHIIQYIQEVLDSEHTITRLCNK